MLMRNLEKDDVRAVSHQTQTGQPAGSSIFCENTRQIKLLYLESETKNQQLG